MPTYRHGKGSQFWLSNSSSTASAVKLSSGIEELTFSRSIDTAEVTAYQDNDRNYIAGLRSATISLTGIFASTYESHLAGIIAAPTAAGQAFVFAPGSTATNNRKEKGLAILTSYEVGAPVGDKVNMKVNLQVTGAVTSTKW